MSESAIVIKSGDLEATVKKLRLPDDVLRQIMRRAVTKTTRWARTRMRRLFSKSTKISSKIFKGRMKLDIESAEYGHARVWVGLNPISLRRLKPKKVPIGVKTSSVTVPGGFISGSGGEVFKRRGRSRLPIDKQYFDIHQQASSEMTQIANEVSQQLQENFENAYLEIAYK